MAGYRQARFWREPAATELVAAFAQPAPLVATAGAVGDLIAVLPVVYHLLWAERLRADLTRRLDGSSLVAAP